MTTTRKISTISRPKKNCRSPIGICIILSLFFALPLQAQWAVVAPALLGPQQIETGAITHQSGITWAGSLRSVFMSLDSGLTWTNRSPNGLGKNDNIDDIIFFDKKTGVVCTNSGSVYRTDDQGLNWREIHNANGGSGFTFSAAFLNTTDNIIVVSGPGGVSGAVIDVTRDGGMTWKTQRKAAGTSVPQVKALFGGSAVALLGTLGTGLNLIKTTDYGTTWQPMPGTVDFDAYSFDVNPCEPNVLYVVNEKGTSGDNLAEIYSSTDGGTSWQISQSFPINRVASKYFLCGSISLTSKALFVQTVTDGIHRSTDQGATWKSIGGPSATFDTRLLCAINSNIIITADKNGTIWRTISSGGDSLQGTSAFESLSLSPNELFTTDTLVSCDSPDIQSIHLHGIFCKHLKIIGERFQGADSLDYNIVKSVGDSLTGDDSVYLSFRPHGSGSRNGEYIITLEDSTQLAVPLKGFGKDVTFVEPRTHDIAVDTIGGYAQVPIKFNGFLQKEDVEVILNYDPRMTYNGSISLSGRSVDVPGESWSGRTKLRIQKNELSLDTVSGIAIFTVFPEGADCFKVSIDSMNILSSFAPCTYSIGNSVTAMICPPKGCGIMTLTDYLRHGIMPQLRIVPNPATGNITIYSSVKLGNCQCIIFDQLGRTVDKRNFNITEGQNNCVFEKLRSGYYHLKVVSEFSSVTIPLIRVD